MCLRRHVVVCTTTQVYFTKSFIGRFDVQDGRIGSKMVMSHLLIHLVIHKDHFHDSGMKNYKIVIVSHYGTNVLIVVFTFIQ